MDRDILVNINQLIQGMAGVGVGRVTFVAFANFCSVNTALWPSPSYQSHFLTQSWVGHHCIISLPHRYTKSKESALAGVAQWIERRPANQRVTGLIPSQGTCLGCRPVPQLRTCKGQPHIDVSLPLFLFPFPLLLNK